MKYFAFLLLFIIPFLLTACGPPLVFGVPQEQWAQLNEQQRSQIIKGYNKRSQTEAQVAPIYAIASAIGLKN
jgi:hypothetical protein